MTNRISLWGSLLVALFLTLPAGAQALKVGYTDYEVLLANMPQMESVQQQLQSFYTETQQRLQQQAKDFQDKAQRYEKQASLLSAEARTEREQELSTLQQQVQQAAQQGDQQLAQRRAELMRPLFERLQAAIDTVSKRNGLDLVLPTQVGGDPVILYINQERIVDITREVATELGIPVDAEAAAAPGNTPDGN